MKKLILLLTLVFVLGLCACGGKEEKDEDATKAPENETVSTTQPTKEATAQPTEVPTEAPTEAPTEVPTEAPTEAPTETPTEAPTVEPTVEPTPKPTPEPTPEPTKAPEKKYDVYVNGIGFDIGDKVDIKVSIKANDKKFEGCCPSLNFYKEGVKDAEKIEAAIEVDYDNMYTHPEMFESSGDCNYNDSCYSLWSYFNLFSLWDNPDGEPMDITGGVHMFTYPVTFKEAGNYTVDVTSGNGAEGMEEEFAKYDNCLSVEISKKE